MAHPNAKFSPNGERIHGREAVGISFGDFKVKFPALAAGIVKHWKDTVVAHGTFNEAEEFKFVFVRIHDADGVIETYDQMYNGGEFFYDMETLEPLGYQGRERGIITPDY